jgi:hypothetical protein
MTLTNAFLDLDKYLLDLEKINVSRHQLYREAKLLKPIDFNFKTK